MWMFYPKHQKNYIFMEHELNVIYEFMAVASDTKNIP